MDMCPFTDDNWDTLHHIALTLKTQWEQYNKLHEQVHQDQLLNQGKKFKEDSQRMMLAQAGKTTSRKRKAVTIV
jgi:hypothetical protein